MVQKVLQIGAGGWARRWCGEYLPANVRDGFIEVVGLVDINPDVLKAGQAVLGLPDDRCFTNAKDAFSKVKADFCTIVVPPAHHEAIVDLAIANGVHILCEKPIADTIEGSVRTVRKLAAAGLKMAVTLSHRFDQDKQTLERIVRSGELGITNSIVCQIATDFRRLNSWGAPFRHTMADPLLIEGAVHQFEILKVLAGARCTHVYANTWRPAWGEYAGDTDGHVVMQFENGVRAVYSGSATSPVAVPDWFHERIRVEGSEAIAHLNHRELEVFHRLKHSPMGRQRGREGSGQKIPLAEGTKWSHALLIEQFVNWLQGGPRMETDAAASLETDALLFAAVESSRTGKVVEMTAFRERYEVA